MMNYAPYRNAMVIIQEVHLITVNHKMEQEVFPVMTDPLLCCKYSSYHYY